MDRWLARLARIAGAAIGTFAGVVAVQFMRLRRMEFLPLHPGFEIDHLVRPAVGVDRAASPLRLAVFGDSTTAGVGVDRPEDSLPYRLAAHLATAEGQAVHVVSYGWAGARVADVVAQQIPRALARGDTTPNEPFLPQADVVALVVGSNDATHHTHPRRYRAGLRAALEAVRRAAPSARIVLTGIPAFRGALRSIEPLIQLADLYARILRPISRAEAQRVGAAYADLAREVPPRVDRGTAFLSSDRFHPSAIGYAIWADVIFEALVAAPPVPRPKASAPMEPAGA